MIRLLALLVVVPGLAGCFLFPVHDAEVEIRISALAVDVIDSNLERADALYREPRDGTRVEQSLKLCLDSVSSHGGYSGLWRALRASAWLAERHGDEERRHEFAIQGVGLGPGAIALTPNSAETHYYYALCLGQLSSIESRDGGRVPKMAAAVRRVIEIDEKLDRAGAHRFLGLLYLETESYPLIAIGTIDDAFEHLERACELFPDAGDNHLSLARALIEDEEETEARDHLRRVVDSPVPDDQTDEHGEWVEEARALLAELDGD